MKRKASEAKSRPKKRRTTTTTRKTTRSKSRATKKTKSKVEDEHDEELETEQETEQEETQEQASATTSSLQEGQSGAQAMEIAQPSTTPQPTQESPKQDKVPPRAVTEVVPLFETLATAESRTQDIKKPDSRVPVAGVTSSVPNPAPTEEPTTPKHTPIIPPTAPSSPIRVVPPSPEPMKTEVSTPDADPASNHSQAKQKSPVSSPTSPDTLYSTQQQKQRFYGPPKPPSFLHPPSPPPPNTLLALPLDVLGEILSHTPLDVLDTFYYLCQHSNHCSRQRSLWSALIKHKGFSSIIQWVLDDHHKQFLLSLISIPCTGLTSFSVSITNFLISKGLYTTFFQLLKNPAFDYENMAIFALCFAAAYGADEVVQELLQERKVDVTENTKVKMPIGAPITYMNFAQKGSGDAAGGASAGAPEKEGNSGGTDSSGGTNGTPSRSPRPTPIGPAAGNLALQQACYWGCTNVVRVLLSDSRIDPSHDNSAAIRLASARGHTPVVRLLLKDRRSDPCAERSEGLRSASLRGHTEIVRLFLQDGRADPFAESESALKSAVEGAHIEVVNMLVREKFIRVAKSK